MSIVARERALYTDVWSSVEAYRKHSPGEQSTDLFLAMTGATPPATVLDAGCGAGVGGFALGRREFTVTLCDLTAAGEPDRQDWYPFVATCLWNDLRPVAYAAKAYYDGVTDFGQPRPHIQKPDRFDYVYCCDVLEHIPPEYTMLTLARLLEVSSQGLFLTISLVPDQFGVWVGTPLHQTVRPFTWWRDRLRDLGHLVEARDLLVTGAYFVRPR